MTSWVDFAYTVVALIVATLLMYVMQKVEYDRWSKTDALWLQWMRRLAFVIAALALLYSIHSIDWQLTCLILVSTSGSILAINAMALHLRSLPPRRGTRIHIRPHHGFSYHLARLVHYFSHTR